MAGEGESGVRRGGRRLKCHLGRRAATAEGSIPSEIAGTRRRSASGHRRMSKAGELDAMLVMRSAETDGVFIQARGFGKASQIRAEAAVYSFSTSLPTVGRLLRVGAARKSKICIN